MSFENIPRVTQLCVRRTLASIRKQWSRSLTSRYRNVHEESDVTLELEAQSCKTIEVTVSTNDSTMKLFEAGRGLTHCVSQASVLAAEQQHTSRPCNDGSRDSKNRAMLSPGSARLASSRERRHAPILPYQQQVADAHCAAARAANRCARLSFMVCEEGAYVWCSRLPMFTQCPLIYPLASCGSVPFHGERAFLGSRSD